MKRDESKIAGHIGPPAYDSLDPAKDPLRWEQVVTRIVDAAQPELHRRAEQGGWPWAGALERWRRRGLAAAGAVASVAALVLFTLGAPAEEAEAAIVHPADALLSDMADWLVTGEAPTMVALIGEFGGPQ